MLCFFFFFFNDTATTEIYPLSLPDPLPIWAADRRGLPASLRGDQERGHRLGRLPHLGQRGVAAGLRHSLGGDPVDPDRKSTRLNSSHLVISYAVFCLKKKPSSPRRYTLPRP